jgi:hypothetical protein
MADRPRDGADNGDAAATRAFQMAHLIPHIGLLQDLAGKGLYRGRKPVDDDGERIFLMACEIADMGARVDDLAVGVDQCWSARQGAISTGTRLGVGAPRMSAIDPNALSAPPEANLKIVVSSSTMPRLRGCRGSRRISSKISLASPATDQKPAVGAD